MPHDPTRHPPLSLRAQLVVEEAMGGAPVGGGPAGSFVELRATELGLIVTPSPVPGSDVPSLLPWSEMTGVGTRGPDRPTALQLPAALPLRVLEIEMREGGWFGDQSPLRFAAPAPEVEAFGEAVSGCLEARKASGFQLAVALAVAKAAAVSSNWLTLVRRDHGDPRHEHGRSRIGPIAVGLIALVLLAGSSTSFGSSASGALTQRRGDGRQRLPGIRRPPRGQPAARDLGSGTGTTLSGRVASPAVP